MGKMDQDDLPSWCDQELIEELMDMIEEIQGEEESEDSEEAPMVMEIKLSMN